MSLAAGTHLGPFEIVSLIGEGGMGEVYRARDPRLSRDVALKVLPPEVLTDRAHLARFATEARSASALNHPNIVTIYEVGRSGELPYIAMELVDGVTLRALTEDGALTVKKALQIAAQLADGLAKAHAAGIVHRDLKPENVMVTKDGWVKILDFGLAKLAGDGLSPETRGLTGTGLVVGTADYMSPEQASGRPLDFRSDQFALGLVLYEAATGRRAFTKGTAVQTLTAIIQDDPEPVQTRNPRMPAPFCWVIERCLSKDPEERYASTQDLAHELRVLRERLGSEPVESRAVLIPTTAMPRVETPAPTPPVRGWRRLGVLALPVAAGLLLVALGTWAGARLTSIGAEPATRWDGELLLGGTRVFAPLVSPDGQTLAFLTLVGGVAQVAVMKPGSGDWVVLTKRRDLGSVNRIDWSRDGSRIFFDRVSDIPSGVFSIAAVGGDERLVLPDAQSPEALSDGTLVVARVDAGRNFQLHRFAPETGKLAPLGPAIVREAAGLTVRAFPDGRELLVYGKPAGGVPAKSFRAPWLLDLATGALTRFAPELVLNPPFTVTHDGRGVVADVVANDLHRLVEVSRRGDAVKTLLTLESRPWYVSAAPDGTLYVDLVQSPIDLLRFPREGGSPERLAMAARSSFMHPVQFGDGRVVMPSFVSGKKRLLVAAPGEALRPFLETAEQSAPPVALVGGAHLAFLGGASAGQLPVLALASIAEGRVVKRFEETRGMTPLCLAASPDGARLWFVEAGSLYRLEVDSGHAVRVRTANGVAVDPRGGLVVQLDEPDGVKLVRMPEAGGADTPIVTSGALRLSPAPIAGNAVAADGTIVVSVSSKENWFTGPALLSPGGEIRRIPVAFEGSILASAWGGGALLGMGEGLKSELWRFRPMARQ